MTVGRWLVYTRPGVLTVVLNDFVACHLCGRGFKNLGVHVRTHNLSTGTYRRRFGLPAHLPLMAPKTRRAIALGRRESPLTARPLVPPAGHSAGRS